MNDFPCFQNENNSLLCQENGRNMDWNSKVSWIISCALRTKKKLIYFKKMEETWIEKAKYDE